VCAVGGDALKLLEGRFARHDAIPWWSQERLSGSRVLVVGAGALGNEAVKNLSLLGIGSMVIVDMDRIERSNLSRSVLFRELDEGQAKAEVAAREARAIYPDGEVVPIVGNVLADVGLGVFRWANVVVGCLDNREARVFVNQACARVARPWIDGGIETLGGIVRGFAPPSTACYECTMREVDWRELDRRRSCALLARRAVAQGGTPTTATTASVIAAVQVQEVVKLLHGMDGLLGSGWVFEGLRHDSYRVEYPIDPQCPWHGAPPQIEEHSLGIDAPLRAAWKAGEGRLGRLDGLDFSREIVRSLECPRCGARQQVFKPVDHVLDEHVPCPECGTERVPAFFHGLAAESELLDRTPRELGLPDWDIVWVRSGEEQLGIEISGDHRLCRLRSAAIEEGG
jgi:molybdopterin/thiamine biosynthesis adenylyltransferase